MATSTAPRSTPVAARQGLSRAWRWVNVAMAGLAMVATLPGRTQGLGYITEPLLKDLNIGRVDYATLTLLAILLGAVLCLPTGWLLDRLGIRRVLFGSLAALGTVVLVMSQVQGIWRISISMPVPSWWQESGVFSIAVALDLFLLMLAASGLGQSALSVVSLALVGKSVGRSTGPVMGVYALVVSAGFMLAFGLLKAAGENWHADWRTTWAGIGIVIFALAILSLFLVREPEADAAVHSKDQQARQGSLTIWQALASPAFWVFGLATSLYGLIAAGVYLFCQSILAERHFNERVFHNVLILAPMVGLAGNLISGWLAGRWPMGRLLASGMIFLTASLFALPLLATETQVYAFAVVIGLAGGVVTVVFFGIWREAFGPAHLGKVQGAAQMLTVIASAFGPLFLAACKQSTGSYMPLFRYMAIVCAAFALLAWWVPLPNLQRGEPDPVSDRH